MTSSFRSLARVGTNVVIASRGMKKYPFPVTFEKATWPSDGQLKLPVMPAEPTYIAEVGETRYKTSKRMIDTRGVEQLHTSIVHEQFGLATTSGSFISSDDFKFIQNWESPPWTRRWELIGPAGIQNAWEDATPWFKRKFHNTKVNDYEKYDLIAAYRTGSTLEHELRVEEEMQSFEKAHHAAGLTRRRIFRSAAAAK